MALDAWRGAGDGGAMLFAQVDARASSRALPKHGRCAPPRLEGPTRQPHRGAGSQLRSRRLVARAEGSSNGAPAAPKQGPLNVMIAGPPAAGKGTQCEQIVQQFGLVHVSAGDLLRAEVARETPEGKTAASYMNQGNLVPNEVVVQMVVKRLREADAQERGWLLDGYPRSMEQAEAVEKADIRPEVFFHISVPDEELVERVTGRRSDPETGAIYHLKFKPPPPSIPPERLVQREDDTHASLRTRLDTYHGNMEAVLRYYKGVLVEVDGGRPMEDVYASIKEELNRAEAARGHPELQAA